MFSHLDKLDHNDLIILFIIISIVYYIWSKNANGKIIII